MLPTNQYRIRAAGIGDADRLARLAGLDSQRSLEGPILIGELDGEPAAAISLADGRVVADPFRRTAQLVSHLRVRAGVHHAYLREPSLRRRIRAGLRPLAAAASAA